jgi:hypothetical protein
VTFRIPTSCSTSNRLGVGAIYLGRYDRSACTDRGKFQKLFEKFCEDLCFAKAEMNSQHGPR